MTIKTFLYGVAKTRKKPDETTTYLACVENQMEMQRSFTKLVILPEPRGRQGVGFRPVSLRESLDKPPSSERSPSFDTILKVIWGLGLKFSAGVRDEAEWTEASVFSASPY